MYKIVIDSNIIFCDEENQLDKVFNSSLKGVFEFLSSNKISDKIDLCLPQLVLDERITQRILGIEKQYSNMNIASRNLKASGFIKAVEKVFKENKYRKSLNENSSAEIKKYQVNIIPTITVNQDILVKRALYKKTPFYSKDKSDKGFKDTLIWLSLLEDAKNNKKHGYILLTGDSDGFIEEICKKEFEEYSSMDFRIIRNVQELKEFLDDKFQLNLTLKKIYSEVEQEIKSIYGTIMTKVFNYINKNNVVSYGGINLGINLRPTVSLIGISPFKTTDEGISLSGQSDNFGNSFDFYDLKIKDISTLGNNKFNIKLDLIVSDKKDNRSMVYTAYDPFSSENNLKSYGVAFIYERNNYKSDRDASVKIVSVSNSY